MDKDLMNFDANFSVLDRYGTDITKEEYVTDPAIGRDQQIKELILVLLTPEKSAILIGKPGIGKTAIVEGLAYRIQKNDVPEALQGYTILNIKTASLLGTMPNGESKVQKMIDELKTKDKMILFIDEIHMLIGSTETSSVDFANIFKEGLGRGSIKVIGATTTEEYERYILRDKAFTRRFQKIEVPEPSREETIKIMMGTLPKFEKQTGRKMKYTPFIQERIMSFIVDITSEYKRVFSLGSRYPDVCLTLLKQAFSYTVYDNRPYMDIFDIRKAIENSKNIYPDVIKKELPNFDKMFNDIMLEEKGEKPVEEWRKKESFVDETQATPQEEQTSQDIDISNIGNIPDMVDKLEIRDSKPINNIITSTGKAKFARVGSTAVSTGLKEKIKRTTNSKVIDDMLLSSDMDVLKNEGPRNPVYTNFVVTDEIRPGVDDSYLLQRPIQSNVQEEQIVNDNSAYRYRRNQRRNEGRRMWNNDYRPERQDINSQNFDKYKNFFHSDDNTYNQNSENEKRMDMLMSGSASFNQQPPMGPNGMDGPMYPPVGGPMPDPMYQPMNQMPGPGIYPPVDNQMPNQVFPPMNQMPNPGMYPPVGGPMPDPMYQPMPPMQGAGMYPPMNQMPNQMYQPMGNQIPDPMYQPMPNPSQIPQMPNNDSQFDIPKTNSSLFDLPGSEKKPINSSETLFGAPMYSEENKDNSNDSDTSSSDNVDVFGKLLADNMSLKNGEIVNEFPTFEKLNNLSNITTQQNVNPVVENNNFNQFTPMNNNRSWTFLDNNQNRNQQIQNDNNSSFFQKNILEDAKKIKESNENITSPTNNKDYYEDMKSGDFVNFSDLNSGKIKEEDTNKYMGVQVEENKPQYDLNLEGNKEEEDKFDDFYE